MARGSRREAGFSLTEILVVLCGAAIIAGIGVPVVGTMLDHYGVVLAAQQVTTQLQYARMKAVASNEPFLVRFDAPKDSFQVETSNGTLHAGPYFLPRGVSWNSGDGSGAITFPAGYVEFLPSGNLPAAGGGSAGRVKLVNRSGVRVDIVVSAAGMIRATPAFKSTTAPF